MVKQEVAQQYIDDGSLKETAKLLLKAKARPFRSLRKRAFQEEGEFDSIGTDRKAPLFHIVSHDFTVSQAMQHVAKKISEVIIHRPWCLRARQARGGVKKKALLVPLRASLSFLAFASSLRPLPHVALCRRESRTVRCQSREVLT